MNLVFVILSASEGSLYVEQKRSFTSFRACPECNEGMTKDKELIS